jgi:soluble lytic murein transglycosylase-like protein
MRRLFLCVWIFCAVVLQALPAAARPDELRELSGPALYQEIARRAAVAHDLPYPLVDAVIWVESRYNPMATGGVGEIGLMQIRPSTAHMLGFRGSLSELREPANNIHIGTRYLAGAWRLAEGDICTTVMKYRAGHGETRFSQRSVEYCKRVRKHMAAGGTKVAGIVPQPTFGFGSTTARYRKGMNGFVQAPRTKDCYARVVQPGPRFGACIPLSKLLKKGLVVRVTKPSKRKKK